MKINRTKFTHKTVPAFTIIELLSATVIMGITFITIGTLLVNGQRTWRLIYDERNKQTKMDATKIAIKFETIGRKSNRANYEIYDNSQDFGEAQSFTGAPAGVVGGNVVEFRYWDVPLTGDILTVDKTATAYALFYLAGNALKIDYGSWDDTAGRNSPDRTEVLSQNVLVNQDVPVFTHNTVNGKGQGCVNLNLTLIDAEDNETIELKTAILMRNVWP